MGADVKSIAIYWSMLLLTLVIAWLYEHSGKKNKWSKIIWLGLMALPLAVLAGMRYSSVGGDYLNYARMFRRANYYSVFELFSQAFTEPLFFLVIKCCSFISKNNLFIFGAIEFLTLFIAFVAFDRMRPKIDFKIAIILYYFMLYHPSYNIVRQCLAVSIILLAFTYYLEEKYKIYTLICISAFLVHTSAVICLIYLLIPIMFRFVWNHESKDEYQIKKSKYQLRRVAFYLVLLISPFIFQSMLNILLELSIFSKYSKYVSGTVDIGIGTIIQYMVMMLPLLLLNKKSIRKTTEYSLMKDTLIFYLPFSFLGYMASWASRLNMYPQAMLIFLAAYLARKGGLKGNVGLMNIYYFMWFFVSYVYNFLYMNHNLTFPYISW